MNGRTPYAAFKAGISRKRTRKPSASTEMEGGSVGFYPR